MDRLNSDAARRRRWARLAADLSRAARQAERGRAWLFREPAVSAVLLVPAVAAFVYAACVLLVRMRYESLGPYNSDTPIYWTIGHGVLHGLVPYRDLFETKPPGIFLLSALSYALTGDGRLTHATQILSVLTVALAPLAYAPRVFRAWRTNFAALPVFVALWVLVLGLAGFVGRDAQQVQTEAHAMPGMIAYMLLVGASGRWAMVGRAAGIVVAVGMKEPFVLAVPAAYLVLDPAFKRPWEDLVAPLLLAGAAGVAFLVCTGWYVPYVDIYLRSMAGPGGHIGADSSPWSRVMPAVTRTWDGLADYSTVLPVALLYAAGTYLVTPDRSVAAGRSVARRFQALFLGLLLSSMAVGLGFYFYDHHFVFASPFHLAIVLSLMASVARLPSVEHWMRAGIVAVACLAVYVPKWISMDEFRRQFKEHQEADMICRDAAKTIDRVLDRLHVDRFLWVGHPGLTPLPYTKHLPLGPLFFQQAAFFDGRMPWLAKQYKKRLHEAQVLVFFVHQAGNADAMTKRVMASEYDRLPDSYVNRRFPYEIYVRKGTPLR